MELHLNSERQVFNRFYKNHAHLIYGLVTSAVADKKKAREILEDSFVSIWTTTHRPTLTDDKILTNMVVVALRKCSEALSQPHPPF